MHPEPHLASLMQYIDSKYKFNEENYPGFGHLAGKNRRLVFIVRHSQLHMCKSVGKIATEAEAADHGRTISTENLRIATTKMLVNVLKLAEELGMSAEELAAKVPEVMKSK